jgi:glycosyltransferase involved in cell wall biosynthesis
MSGTRQDPHVRFGDARQVHRTALFFIPTLQMGGAERTCVQFVNHVRSVEPVLLSHKPSGSLATELRADVRVIRFCAPLGPRASAVKARLFRNAALRRVVSPCLQAYGLLRQAKHVALVARREHADLIVSFATHPNIIAILAKVLFCHELRVVATVHDMTSQILLHSNLRWHERVALRLLVRWLYPRADRVVAVAEGVKRDLVCSFGIAGERVLVVRNPIDIETVRTKAAEPVADRWFVARGHPMLVAVGRLVRLKGFEFLIRAIPLLDAEVSLAIVGDGPERGCLEGIAEECGVRGRVRFLSLQPNPWKFMARADIFVLPSLTEGLPWVVGEAMALGLPIVATDCSPSLKEYLGEQEAGLIVRPGDPSVLATAITRLLGDDKVRKQLGECGRSRVAQFDLARSVETFEEAIRRCLAPRGKRNVL